MIFQAAPRTPFDKPILRVARPEPPDVWTLRRVCDELLEDDCVGCKPTTIEGYMRDVDYFEQWAALTPDGQRLGQPLTIDAIDSRAVKSFIRWIIEDRELSASTAVKAKNTIARLVRLAGDNGHEVKTIHARGPRVRSREKYYIDDLQVTQLWTTAGAMQWPRLGPPPSVFWRAAIVLYLTYGMRVQDLIAYQPDKRPITWGAISLDPRSPNPEGRSENALGWLTYTAAKTGRRYYLPLTKYTRAAVDRLWKAASGSGGDWHARPKDRPLLPCPTGHGLGRNWRLLQRLAHVSRPDGAPYWLEDFRKTCATYLYQVEPELAYLVCGWSTAASRVAHGHYINGEPALVQLMHSVPWPRCFDDWLDP